MKNLYPLFFLFLITVQGFAQADIDLKHGATSINDGDTYTGFPSTRILDSQTETFTIENNGSSSLVFNPLNVLISGPNAGDFSATNPTNNVAPAGTTSIDITFTPTASGTRVATFQIINNSPAPEDTFTFTLSVSASTALYAKGTVTVDAGGLLYVEGCVEIPSGGTINNNGTVEVNDGNWLEDGDHIGSGLVRFQGGDVNYISGSSVNFHDVELEKYAQSVGINVSWMELRSTMEISGTLSLDSGMIVTGPSEVYLTSTATTAINGGANGYNYEESNYILGTLRREIDAPARYIWPVGSSGNGYMPVELDMVTKNSSATNIRVNFQDEPDMGNVLYGVHNIDCSNFPVPNSGLPANQDLAIDQMVDLGYWNMVPDAQPEGSDWLYNMIVYPDFSKIEAANSGLTFLKILKVPGSVNVGSWSSFDWSSYVLSSGNLCDGLNVDGSLGEFFHPYYSSDAYHGQTGLYLPVDSLVATELTSFSRGAMGGGGGAGLPIELLSLTAEPVNNKYILVSWATATEINNAGFQVLRSTDGVNFEQIAWVDGHGNTSTQQNYAQPDYDVVPNVKYYYKLNQIDFDGASEMTYVVSAMLTTESTFTISEFIPNPSQNNSNIEVVTGEPKKMNFTVYNTLGQVIRRFDYEAQPGTNKVSFELDDVADGTYFAIIIVDNDIYNRKLIISK